MPNGNTHQRTPQESHGEEETFRSLLAAASDVAGRVLASIQAIAGTTSCKRVQIHALHQFALEQGCWIDDCSVLGVFSDRGSENEVYLSLDNKMVYKLNDFRYADDNLSPFFERIEVHNKYFPECSYRLLGFAKNQSGNICAVFFSNGQYDIFDALPNNVLVGYDDELYFIDTIIYRSEETNLSVYQSLSPRFSD